MEDVYYVIGFATYWFSQCIFIVVVCYLVSAAYQYLRPKHGNMETRNNEALYSENKKVCLTYKQIRREVERIEKMQKGKPVPEMYTLISGWLLKHGIEISYEKYVEINFKHKQ